MGALHSPPTRPTGDRAVKDDRKFYLIGVIAITIATVGAISLHKAGMRLTADADQTTSDASVQLPARID